MRAARQGFTLIELLIVVVIIGILAAIAIPKFANTKAKAYVASMKTDLRNLVTSQEAYFSDYNSTYASTIASMGTNFAASSGVTVVIGGVTNTGWAATATHMQTAKTCTITYGGGSTVEGAPTCQ